MPLEETAEGGEVREVHLVGNFLKAHRTSVDIFDSPFVTDGGKHASGGYARLRPDCGGEVGRGDAELVGIPVYGTVLLDVLSAKAHERIQDLLAAHGLLRGLLEWQISLHIIGNVCHNDREEGIVQVVWIVVPVRTHPAQQLAAVLGQSPAIVHILEKQKLTEMLSEGAWEELLPPEKFYQGVEIHPETPAVEVVAEVQAQQFLVDWNGNQAPGAGLARLRSEAELHLAPVHDKQILPQSLVCRIRLDFSRAGEFGTIEKSHHLLLCPDLTVIKDFVPHRCFLYGKSNTLC